MAIQMSDIIDTSGLTLMDINNRNFRWSDNSLAIFYDICPGKGKISKDGIRICDRHQHCDLEHR